MIDEHRHRARSSMWAIFEFQIPSLRHASSRTMDVNALLLAHFLAVSSILVVPILK
jgi:hypothetical protein